MTKRIKRALKDFSIFVNENDPKKSKQDGINLNSFDVKISKNYQSCKITRSLFHSFIVDEMKVSSKVLIYYRREMLCSVRAT